MRYALVIGNSQYTDPKLAQLKTPAADSQKLSQVLRDQKIGQFDEVTSLINSTEFKAKRAISRFLSNKKADDLVLLYFSGHGVLDERGRLFLALKDTHTELLKATAIPASFISEEMDSCRSKRQLLILDCCHSGAFERGAKGDRKAVTAATFEGDGFGRVVLTASDSTQYALEGDQVIQQAELSLFTHFLLKGLTSGEADKDHDGWTSLDEWYDYTFENVRSATPKQVPHKWSYHQQGDLRIARNPFWTKEVPQLSENLRLAIQSGFVSVRETAVKELGALLGSQDSGLAELARLELEKLTDDDSRTVSAAAAKVLSEYRAVAEKESPKRNQSNEETRTEPEPIPIPLQVPETLDKSDTGTELLEVALPVTGFAASESQPLSSALPAPSTSPEPKLLPREILRRFPRAIAASLAILVLAGVLIYLGASGQLSSRDRPAQVQDQGAGQQPAVPQQSDSAGAIGAVLPTASHPSPAASATPTSLPTPAPEALLPLHPQQWNGLYTYPTGEKQRISLLIEKLNGTKFTGKMIWQSFDRYRGAILKMNGEFVTEFGQNQVEQTRWNNLSDYKNGERNGIWLKWTETEVIDGGNYTTNGWYYAHIREDGQMVAVYFFNKDELVADVGAFVFQEAGK